ncbi:MAG: 16S rRNA (cytidine(1402)-2'-O)-methyltransferase [Lachnospiraceae bacterium]|nr:16S rRNA (cytidine(1402)-2'-O)-methyltransferase [Lachnospiraceae bacterium]
MEKNKTDKKEGMLYLCATPIGNLKDITTRVLETLSQVDLIAAEDTRNSIHLLNHFGIKTPMTSYHEFNKYDKADILIGRMKAGEDIALITDAGTPAISDPGEVLVRRCHEEGVNVTSLPGPAACITALTLSGLSTRRFAFEGFLPHDKKEREQVLEDLKDEYRTVIIYEAPHHLRATLDILFQTLGNRKLCLCRELTKRFETVIPTDLCSAIELYEEEEPKGEYVLVLEGADKEADIKKKQESFLALSIEEHVAHYEAEGLDRKAAMKKAAEDRGVPKREIYDALYRKDR